MTEPNPSFPSPVLPDRAMNSPEPDAPAPHAAVPIPCAPVGPPPMPHAPISRGPIGPPPMPVAAVPYAFSPPDSRRPGIITSIGVISIVVACLSGLASLSSGCQAGGLYFISTISPNMPATAAVSTPGTSTNSTTTMSVTSNSSSMSVFASAGPSTASTSMPSTALSAIQVNSAVQAVQWTSGTPPTPAQISALRAALANPNQQLVLPGNPASSPSSGVIDASGNAYVTFPGGGVVSIDRQGQIIASPFAGNGMGALKVNKVACGLTILDAALSGGLAIFLFVAGILILRSSPGSRRLHLIYAVIKIPLVLGGTVASTWMYAEFYASPAVGAGGGAMRAMAIGWGVAFLVAGLIYPIALLLALNTRGMRDYFRPVPLAMRQ